MHHQPAVQPLRSIHRLTWHAASEIYTASRYAELIHQSVHRRTLPGRAAASPPLFSRHSLSDLRAGERCIRVHQGHSPAFKRPEQVPIFHQPCQYTAKWGASFPTGPYVSMAHCELPPHLRSGVGNHHVSRNLAHTRAHHQADDMALFAFARSRHPCF